VGGTLTVNSRPGGGAEVTFQIPRGPFAPADEMEMKL
jgi:signal transduction histidine kinase